MLTKIRHLNYITDSPVETVTIPSSLLDDTNKGTAIALYAVIQRYADPQTGQLAATRIQLAHELGKTSRAPVDQAVEELSNLGYLKAERLWVTTDSEPLAPLAHQYALESGVGRVSAGSLYTLIK